tara:strand:- start:106 stop:384 length:279 start_codon:yes stop_codon:yes gene_type:complete
MSSLNEYRPYAFSPQERPGDPVFGVSARGDLTAVKALNAFKEWHRYHQMAGLETADGRKVPLYEVLKPKTEGAVYVLVLGNRVTNPDYFNGY